MSRRRKFVDYYKNPHVGPAAPSLASMVRAAATNADRYVFHGPQVVDAVVVRSDLNKYSKWAQSKALYQRAQLLDDFFSRVVLALDVHNGVFFRDEGDCIVSVFSTYFGSPLDFGEIESFAKAVTAGEYGVEKLTAKTNAAVGKIGIFQKAHEVGTDDWSAEGEAFVRAARLEQMVDSEKRISFYKEEFDTYFKAHGSYAQPGQTYHWLVDEKSYQVEGFGMPGGWVATKFLEHLDPPRIQA